MSTTTDSTVAATEKTEKDEKGEQVRYLSASNKVGHCGRAGVYELAERCVYVCTMQEEVESPEVHFEPVVKLAPVEVKTNEEGEKELFRM